MSALATRVLSALVFTPAVLAAIWLGGRALQLTCAVVAAGMVWEYAELTWAADQPDMRRATWLTGGVGLLLSLGLLPPRFEAACGPAVVIVSFLVVLARPAPLAGSLTRLAVCGIGALYCTTLLPLLLRLRALGPDGRGLALLALLATWGSDTGAYFCGRALGRRRLYAAVSPNKTVEGGIGGVLCGILAALVVRRVTGMAVPATHVACMGAVAAVCGTAGDLCESLLKRSVGKKDSSKLLPGHGGLLDRFDGVLFAVPAVYVYALML